MNNKYKMTSIFPQSVKVDGKRVAEIAISGGHSITLTDCWYAGYEYNGVHNAYCVKFSGFFVTIKCRKIKRYIHSKLELSKEIERSKSIAQKILQDIGVPKYLQNKATPTP